MSFTFFFKKDGGACTFYIDQAHFYRSYIFVFVVWFCSFYTFCRSWIKNAFLLLAEWIGLCMELVKAQATHQLGGLQLVLYTLAWMYSQFGNMI